MPGVERTRKRFKLEEDSLAEREKRELESFFKAAKNIFGHLKEAGVRMDLAELTSCPDGGFDEVRFRMHVAPNKARTGMRYARLLRSGHVRSQNQGQTPLRGKRRTLRETQLPGIYGSDGSR